MKLKNLNQFNEKQVNPHRIHLAGGISYPTVTKYLAGEVQEPTISAIVGVLTGMGIDWRYIRLGELVEVDIVSTPHPPGLPTGAGD